MNSVILRQGDGGGAKTDGKDECAKLQARLADATGDVQKAKEEIRALENEVSEGEIGEVRCSFISRILFFIDFTFSSILHILQINEVKSKAEMTSEEYNQLLLEHTKMDKSLSVSGKKDD